MTKFLTILPLVLASISISSDVTDSGILIGKNDNILVLNQSSFGDIQDAIDDFTNPKAPPERTEWMKTEEYEKILENFNKSLEKDYIFYAVEIGLSTCSSSSATKNMACYDVDDEVFYINRFDNSIVNLNRDFFIDESVSSTSRYDVDGASIDLYDVNVIDRRFLSLNVNNINNDFHQVDVPYDFKYMKDNFYLFGLYGLIKIPLNQKIFSQDKIISQVATKEIPNEIIDNKEIMNVSFESYLLTHDNKIIKNFGASNNLDGDSDSLTINLEIKPEVEKIASFRDGEYVPLFRVTPVYPRRPRERGIMGYTIVSFTITETGNVEDVVTKEGFCTTKYPFDFETMQSCSMFNSASERAALKLKYKPRIVDGKSQRVENVLYKFSFVLDN